MSDPKAKHIRIKVLRETDRVLLNDQDERHPNGHVLIRGEVGKTHLVGDTRRVRELIEAGTFELVEPKEAKDARTAGSTATPS